MSTIELIILGIVMERPASAYDIQKDIDGHNLSLWAKISAPSIYKKVIQLKDKGYLVSEQTKDGNMPEKSIYQITESGKKYFESLMEHFSMQQISIIFDFNVVIANLLKLDKVQAKRLVENISTNIERTKDLYNTKLAEHANIPYNGKTIIEQQKDVMEALSTWVNNFSKEFDEN